MEGLGLGWLLPGNQIPKGGWHYTYDPLSRLTSATDGETSLQFSYDPLGRRLSKQVNDQPPEYYLYDGNQELGAYQSNHPKNLHLPGIAVELEGEIFALILDCHGNSLHLVSLLSESIAASYQQTSFGELLASSGNLQHPWRYAGKRLDPETGLVYFGHRYYDPTLGRWLTTDPAGFRDSLNLYQYVLNNPFRYYDPDGQFAIVFSIPLTAYIFEAALAFLTAPISAPVLAAVAVGSVACVAIAAHPEFIDHTRASINHAIWGNQAMAHDTLAEEPQTASPEEKKKKQRNAPPSPDQRAEGKPHTIIERPGGKGQYTTYNEDGSLKQYRGDGKPHGNVPRPNVKENKIDHSPNGPIPGRFKVRPARPDEIPPG